jgi:hypothetical protein
VTGVDYWLRTLAPYANAGYRHGVVTAEEVLLVHETSGDRSTCVDPRPVAGWQPRWSCQRSSLTRMTSVMPKLEESDGSRQ